MPTENPFQDPLRFERRVPECAVVIFGATGDLTRRKLMPALYRLAYDRRLSAGFAIVGISRRPLSDDAFRDQMREAVQQFSEDTPFDEGVWRAFAAGLFYMSGDIGDGGMFERLARKLAEVEAARHTGGNALFYLAIQPSQYAPAALGLGAAGLAKGNGWRRLVVEKPFGHDLASSRQLSDELHRVFPESEVYRIDHYLGKETVQNILAFRFGNGIFEPLWNRRYIDHVQITAAESIGVEGRGSYYQEAGALADMIQNHLLQVMATMAMEPSAGFTADAVRDERAKLLRSIKPMTPDEIRCNTVPGQYGPARIGGEDVPGFRQEPGVDAQSQTDTYAAVTFFVENWRWAGVPFYVRTGKRLPKRVTEIAIQFRRAPLAIFGKENTGLPPDLLIVRIQPEEGISLKFLAKRPGAGMHLRPVSMDFNYGTSFGERSPSAYETLLLDAIIGDATLYTRQDMVEASWAAVEPIQDVWRNTAWNFPNYAAGTWGPPEADAMLARNGHVWRKP
ncbi:MAG TPA: glucose-6-phosphate dehydrogenase [Bryobacteraceae bacterium]|jgi:glucose-6-phosphate 1-dehydrogenase|nr:glucose-6-phosphate dehydrogenase [Bryobacteraceae bacterium]